MRDYVKQCQELPPGGIQGMLPRTNHAIWMRNMSMRMMTRWPLRNLVSRLFQKADAVELDDYFASAMPEGPAVACARTLSRAERGASPQAQPESIR
jgi:hypothetical protein